MAGSVADESAVGEPERRSVGSDVLDKNIVVDAVAVILPGDERAPLAIGNHLGIILKTVGDGELNPSHVPERIAGGAHFLNVNLIVQTVPAVLPRQKSAVPAVRNKA